MEQSEFPALSCLQPLHSSVEGKYAFILLEALCFEVAELQPLGLCPNY